MKDVFEPMAKFGGEVFEPMNFDGEYSEFAVFNCGCITKHPFNKGKRDACINECNKKKDAKKGIASVTESATETKNTQLVYQSFKTLKDSNIYADKKLVGKLTKGTSVDVSPKPFKVNNEDGYIVDAYELKMPNYIDTYIYGYSIGLGTKPTTRPATPPVTPPVTTPAPAMETTPDAPATKEKFLGMPKKIGIGVTIGVGVLAIGLTTFFLLRRK